MKEKEDQGEKFVRIPTVIFEAIYKTDMRPKGSKLFHFICRKTFGWHKPWDGISQKQFKSATDINSNYDLLQELDILLWQNLILVRKKGVGKRTLYSIETDVKKWRSWNLREYCKDRKLTRLSRHADSDLSSLKNLSTMSRQVPREIQETPNLSCGTRAVPRENAKKEKTESGDRGQPVVLDTSANLSCGTRAQPVDHATSAHPQKIKAAKEARSKDRASGSTFASQIKTAKDMLERKQSEIRKIEEYLTSKNATERQRKKWQTEFDSLAEDITEMKRVVHEAETGKPITAKTEITKKLRVKVKPEPEPKPEPKPAAEESEVFEDAIEFAKKEKQKSSGMKSHERTNRMEL